MHPTFVLRSSSLAVGSLALPPHSTWHAPALPSRCSSVPPRSAVAAVKLQAVPLLFEYANVNGEPALLIELPAGTPDTPIHICARVEMDATGKARVYEVITSPRKLRGLRHRFRHLP